MCRYQRGEHARVEAPAGAPPIVLLPGFGNCTQDYVAPFGDEEAGVAAVLQVGRVTAGLGWLRCRAGHESEACRLQGWAAGLAQVSTGLRFPCTCAWARPTLLPPTSLAHSAAGRCVRCPCAHGKQLSPAPFCLLSSAPPAAPRLPRLRSAADEAGLVQGWARAVHPRLLEHQLHHAPRLHLVRLSRLPISVLPFCAIFKWSTSCTTHSGYTW